MLREILSVGMFSIPLSKDISEVNCVRESICLLSSGAYLFGVHWNALSKDLWFVVIWKFRPSRKC